MRRTQCTLSLLAMTVMAAVVLSASPAFGLADIQITAMSVQGTPKAGNCNKVSMTVRNNGDAFTGNATLDIELITYPTGTPTQNRATQSLFISPMQPGAQTTFTISDVDFKAQGSATVQGLADSTQETNESNENNNSRTATTNVSGSCYAPPIPPTGGNQGCDVEAIFTAPTSGTVPANTAYAYKVQFTNKGSAACDAFKVKLMRYNNTTCSGYGSQIGGSGAWVSVSSLRGNGSYTASFNDKKTPSKGKACLQLGYSPNNYSDDNNTNHRPKKVVKYQ